ncbi:hypothetical protein TWF481_010265 [Arthrobotrys musiformis]|uniref:F-box domain-containing protein n=1 Tax=Arthrobotrys musiformis TaxID=47236 RepID=A0AAV9W1P2_9PEZI
MDWLVESRSRVEGAVAVAGDSIRGCVDVLRGSRCLSFSSVGLISSSSSSSPFPLPLLFLLIVIIIIFFFLIAIAITSTPAASPHHRHRLRHHYHQLQLQLQTLLTTLLFPVTPASFKAWSLLTSAPIGFLPPCFMQSAPSTTLPNNHTHQSLPSTQQSSDQHGIYPSGSLPPPPHHSLSGFGEPIGGDDDASHDGNNSGDDIGRQTNASDPAAQLLSSSRSSPDIKGKSVANKKFKCPNAKGDTYIVRLPNEVLTHTLSFLDPVSLTSVSFVSRRFHALVTSPHAWKDAFSRYFPQHNTHSGSDVYPATARYFTRLSNMGTHRSEYILRTQLLRSLKRGRPYVNSGIKPNSSNNSSNFSMITYNPKLHESTITHLHADFSRNRVIAASQYTGLYSYSDPRTGYVEVEQRGHPGYASFGLQYISPDGIGAMDLSESRGQIIGDARAGFPSFFVERTNGPLAPIRFVNEHGPDAAITCTWISKKDTIVNTSGNRIVSASGSSKGVVQFQDSTNRWMSFLICPGIPILEIRIDDGYTKARERRNRIWCIVVNALGEVWYMKGKLPNRLLALGRNMGEQPQQEFTPWYYIPATKKDDSPVGFGILAPAEGAASLEALQEQNTWMHADQDIMAVTYSDHWGFDYFIEADFGGQNFIVGRRGGEEGPNSSKQRAEMARFTRVLDNVREELISEVFIKNVYGRGYHKQVEEPVPRPINEIEPPDEWRKVELLIPKNTGKDWAFITAIAIDMSNLALLSPNEDPILTRPKSEPSTPQQVAGQLSRLFAVGTDTGTVHIYNARHPASSSVQSLPPLHTITTASPSISSLALSSLYLVHGGTDGLVQAWDPLVSLSEPIRAIHSRFSTRARRRLAQAATSVHGIGENQFAARAIYLDPDATQLRGIVALGTHIRSWSFSCSVEKVSENSSARRRKKNARGGGMNYVNGRGRGMNSPKTPLGRDILDERERIEKVKWEDERSRNKMAARFGVGEGMTEEEMVMYAMMISEETFEKERGSGEDSSFGGSLGDGAGVEEEVWVYSESTGGSASGRVSEAGSPWGDDEAEGSGSSRVVGNGANTNDDEALAKALQETFNLESGGGSPGVEIPIKFAKGKKGGNKGKGKVAVPSSGGNGEGSDQFERDLELAIQLSMGK